MGIKVITTRNSIKIFGNPKLEINKKIVIQKCRDGDHLWVYFDRLTLIFQNKWNPNYSQIFIIRLVD